MKSLVKNVLASVVLAILAVNATAEAVAESTEAVVAQSSVERDQTVNINTADAQAIAAALKGVGLKKAEAIVAYRDQNGEFKSLEELTDVKGIGAATLDKNAANILF